MIALWLTLGLFGRDPWKPDEAYTFGLVHHILQTGDWVVPTLAGEPFMEKPPLFFVTAAFFAKLFGSVLSLPDAARLATAFYVGLTLLFIGLTANRLCGRDRALPSALLLLGCIGYFHPAHLLVTDNALVAGTAMGIYGLSLARQRPVLGGLALGTGAGIAFLSKGLIGPGILGLTAIALLPATRTRRYVGALAVAAIALAPWALIWSSLLYQRSPALFHEWLFVNNFGRYTGSAHLGPEHDHFMYLKILPWFALPVLPLALTNVFRRPRNVELALPLTAFLVMLGVLSSACNSRYLYALPMFVPLALLAGAANPPPWLSAALRRSAVLLGAAVAATFWLGWAALVRGWPAGIADALLAARPGFEPRVDALLVGLAVAVTLSGATALWVARSGTLGVPLSWAATVAIGWGLLNTLWLPYQDYGISYRSVVAEVRAHLPRAAGCIANRSLGEPQRAMLEYFAGLVTLREDRPEAGACDILLVQQDHTQQMPRVGPAWQPIWSGSRPGDATERFWLFRRHVTLPQLAPGSALPAEKAP